MWIPKVRVWTLVLGLWFITGVSHGLDTRSMFINGFIKWGLRFKPFMPPTSLFDDLTLLCCVLYSFCKEVYVVVLFLFCKMHGTWIFVVVLDNGFLWK